MALKYMGGREFVRRLLSGERDFSRIRLEEGFNFDDPNFTHNLSTYLLNRDLSKDKIILHGSELRYVKLNNYNLAYTCGEGVDFTGANLADSNFQRAYFAKSSFLQAILSNVNFKGVCLNYADLRESKLHFTSFSHASLDHADLREAVLNDVSFECTTLYGTDLRGISGLENVTSMITAKFFDTKVTEKEKTIIEKLLLNNSAFTLMNK